MAAVHPPFRMAAAHEHRVSIGVHRPLLPLPIETDKDKKAQAMEELKKQNFDYLLGPLPQAAAYDVDSKPAIPIFVDIPDLDNPLMCLSVLQAFEAGDVNIILTPRPVDFSVRRFAEEKDALKAKLIDLWGFDMENQVSKDVLAERVLRANTGPNSRPWVKDIRDKELTLSVPQFETREELHIWSKRQAQKDPATEKLDEPPRSDRYIAEYFDKPDGDFRNAQVQEDTELYMRLSAYRFANFLYNQGIASHRFRIYWDPESMYGKDIGPDHVQSTIKPILSHAQHVPDYSYGLDEQGRGEFHKANWLKNPEDRRAEVRKLCEDYIRESEKSWGTDYLGKFNDLILVYKDAERQGRAFPAMRVFIGGPFTEALKWLIEGLPMKVVTAMAFNITGKTNIFPNQFNVACDQPSADMFLKEVLKKPELYFLLVPSERIKDQLYRLSTHDLAEIFGVHVPLLKKCILFMSQSGSSADVYLFDWLTVIVHRLDQLHQYADILDKRQVLPSTNWAPKENSELHEKVSRIRLAKEDEFSNIWMCFTIEDLTMAADIGRRFNVEAVKMMKGDLLGCNPNADR